MTDDTAPPPSRKRTARKQTARERAAPEQDAGAQVAGEQAPGEQAGGERIAKRLARAGLCSRRDAERWIAEGRVSVDGQVLVSPAVIVTAESHITVDGNPVAAPERTRLWRYHKPRGLITSNRDPEGRPTIFDRLPPELPRVLTVGRLDLNSEGLLLLTNDGGLARELELPSRGWIRRYRVRVFGTVDANRLASLSGGVTVDGQRYGPIRAEVEIQRGDNTWLVVSLQEGRNREVRRVMEHLGYPVSRLIRVAYGPFQLGSLPRGAVEEVPARVLRDQLGTGRSGGQAVKKLLPKARRTEPGAESQGADAPARRRSARAERSG